MFINKDFPCSTTCYTMGRGGKKIEYIVVHYTGGTGNAQENAQYFMGGATHNSSAHFFIDGRGIIYQSVDPADTAWAVGNFDMNQRSVSIEVCSAGEDFTQAEISELAELVQALEDTYDVPAGRVCRHFDCYDIAKNDGYGSGAWIDPHKHCPAPYIDNDKWYILWLTIVGTHNAAESGMEYDDSNDEPIELALEVDGYWGFDTTLALQKLFGTIEDGIVSHQWYENKQDGLTSGWEWDDTLSGSQLIRAIQTKLGCVVDGIIGPKTISALQAHYGTTVDGELWDASPCIKAMQQAINKGEF